MVKGMLVRGITLALHSGDKYSPDYLRPFHGIRTVLDCGPVTLFLVALALTDCFALTCFCGMQVGD